MSTGLEDAGGVSRGPGAPSSGGAQPGLSAAALPLQCVLGTRVPRGPWPWGCGPRGRLGRGPGPPVWSCRAICAYSDVWHGQSRLRRVGTPDSSNGNVRQCCEAQVQLGLSKGFGRDSESCWELSGQPAVTAEGIASPSWPPSHRHSSSGTDRGVRLASGQLLVPACDPSALSTVAAVTGGMPVTLSHQVLSGSPVQGCARGPEPAFRAALPSLRYLPCVNSVFLRDLLWRSPAKHLCRSENPPAA